MAWPPACFSWACPGPSLVFCPLAAIRQHAQNPACCSCLQPNILPRCFQETDTCCPSTHAATSWSYLFLPHESTITKTLHRWKEVIHIQDSSSSKRNIIFRSERIAVLALTHRLYSPEFFLCQQQKRGDNHQGLQTVHTSLLVRCHSAFLRGRFALKYQLISLLLPILCSLKSTAFTHHDSRFAQSHKSCLNLTAADPTCITWQWIPAVS